MTTTIERGAPADEVMEDGEAAAEPRHYPLDRETGQPHLLRRIHVEATTPDGNDPTYHHDFYYRRDPHLGGGTVRPPEELSYEQVVGLGLRMSSGLYLPRALHELVHDKERFPLGPTRPTHVFDKFERSVTGAVGIRPRRVLDLSRPVGKELVLVKRHEWEEAADPAYVGIERFRNPKGLDKAQRTLSMSFFRISAMRDWPHIDGMLKADFMGEPLGSEHKLEFGYQILMEGLEAAVEPFLPRLNRLWRKGLVQPGRQEPMVEFRLLMQKKCVEHVVELLDSRLKARATIEGQLTKIPV